MTEQEVVELMQSSKNEDEWNDNCDRVKRHFGGYPPFWYHAIVLSGLAGKKISEWKRPLK